ncbi:LuxR C-terminal-related transcriptional regulator [Paenarthrobacter nicotinovorans]|uniref:LuxR C-terminal-related transcriptional regulator n=1 Tax=Paenarthrobacter nicotinovorans TaxID=29320 RepID=A0ABV0GLN4_PAENI
MTHNASGLPVAPQVSAALLSYSSGAQQSAAGVADALTSSQLAGFTALPDPLPLSPTPETLAIVDGLSTAERRLLALAVSSVSNRVSVLLAASTFNIDTLLHGRLAQLLTIDDGHFHPTVSGLRYLAESVADPRELRQANVALAGALRRRGHPGLAAWHSMLANGLGPSSDHGDLLLRLAQTQLDRGAAAASQSIAGTLAGLATGTLRGRAYALAARAALLAGHIDDADRLLTAATADIPGLSRGDLRTAVDILRQGSDEGPVARHRWAAQIFALRSVVTAPGDRAAFAAMAEGYQYWWTAPEEADALMANAVATASKSVPGWALETRTEATTPLGEAFLRLMEAAFQMQAGEFHAAGSTLAEAVPRLPLIVPGGSVSSLIRLVLQQQVPFDESLIETYEAIARPNRIDHVIFGPPTGARTTAASRTRFPASKPASLSVDASGLHLFVSPREREVLALLAEGLSNGRIGERLNISVRTVEVHLGKIYRKTGTTSRHELIARALRGD